MILVSCLAISTVSAADTNENTIANTQDIELESANELDLLSNAENDEELATNINNTNYNENTNIDGIYASKNPVNDDANNTEGIYTYNNEETILSDSKITPIINVDNITIQSGKNVIISFNVTDNNGKLINGETIVTLSWENNAISQYVELENGKGLANFSVELLIGKVSNSNWTIDLSKLYNDIINFFNLNNTSESSSNPINNDGGYDFDISNLFNITVPDYSNMFNITLPNITDITNNLNITLPDYSNILNNITIPDITQLLNITLPDYSSILNNITIPNITDIANDLNMTLRNITNIFNNITIQDVTKLLNITLPDYSSILNNMKIPDITKLLNITLPNYTKIFNNMTIQNITKLLNITLPNITSILNNMKIPDVTKLLNITLPDYSSILNNITIPDITQLLNITNTDLENLLNITMPNITDIANDLNMTLRNITNIFNNITIPDITQLLNITLPDYSNIFNISNWNITSDFSKLNKIISYLFEGNKGIIWNYTFTPGIYNITIRYIGDENYNDAVNDDAKVIIVSGQKITANDVVMYYKDGSRYVVTLTDYDGNPLADETITIKINGESYTRKTNSNGSASMAINLNAGNHTVSSSYTAKDNTTTIVENTITILSTVEGNDLVKVFRNDSQYYATFLDNQGKILDKDTVVTFNINGVMYERKVNEKGAAKLNINLEAGEYVITATNPVTGEMHSNIITVLSTIQSGDLVKYFRNESQYIATLIGKDGKTVGAGETITFNINGVFYERQTNASGQAKLNINLAPGKYIITGEYNDCKVSNTVEVLPILTAADITKTTSEKKAFEAKLVDGQGNPLSKKTVTFNINGVIYNRVTDSNGIAKLNINLQKGEYIITSSYNGQNIANTVTVNE